MATLYRENGTTEEVVPKNGKSFTLEELQTLVGGDIELVYPLIPKKILVVNEEGKLKGMAYNREATKVARSGLKPDDLIVGPALLCSMKEVR